MTEAAHKLNVSEDVLTWNAHGKTVTVHCFANTARAGNYIADAIAEALRHAVDVRGKAVWIGCGGTTPKPIYQHLIHAEMDWSKVTLAQVDERFVPVVVEHHRAGTLPLELATELGRLGAFGPTIRGYGCYSQSMSRS